MRSNNDYCNSVSACKRVGGPHAASGLRLDASPQWWTLRFATALHARQATTSHQTCLLIVLCIHTSTRCSHCSAGLLLPILGALPDSLIIIVSGLGGTLAEAQEQVGPRAMSAGSLWAYKPRQPASGWPNDRGLPMWLHPCGPASRLSRGGPAEASCRLRLMGDTTQHVQVAVGVGTLAGSTIMLLTIAWGGSVWAGRCDIGPSVRAWACHAPGSMAAPDQCICCQTNASTPMLHASRVAQRTSSSPRAPA